MMTKTLTKTDATYLRFIYDITGRTKIVSPSVVAKHFNVSRVSAMEKLKKLANGGYGKYIRRKGFVLNERGSSFAEKAIRKHRIFECVLFQKLGFHRDLVCVEASKVDFYLSDAIVERMSEVLGHPKVCPCGNPILPGGNEGRKKEI